jgi:hypothetical protein
MLESFLSLLLTFSDYQKMFTLMYIFLHKKAFNLEYELSLAFGAEKLTFVWG